MRIEIGGSPFPYFFLLCTEGLVDLLNSTALNNSLKGIKVCRSALEVNHLLFANYSLIFYKANMPSSPKLLEILKDYELVS